MNELKNQRREISIISLYHVSNVSQFAPRLDRSSQNGLKRRKPKPEPPIKQQRTKKKKEKRQQLIFNENHTAPPYPVETSVNPVHATGRFCLSQETTHQTISAYPPPPLPPPLHPQPSVTSVS